MIDINLNNINKSFGIDQVLKNINLTINKGERVALIGSNGCGKTTLLKLIAKEEEPTSGDISIRKDATIGYLSQTPISYNIPVEEYIYTANEKIVKMQEKLDSLAANLSSDIKIITKYTRLQEEFINIGGYEYDTKISKILSAFNITSEMLKENFQNLSGGEKTIISLIRLLLLEPDILILDEPTNHLDIEKTEWLESYLSSYPGTIIIASHDRYFLDKVISKVFLITKFGIEIYFGNYSYFIEENEARLVRQFQQYKDQQKIITAMKDSIKRLKEYGRLCGDSGGEIFYRRAASIQKRLERLEVLDKPAEKKALPINFSMAKRTGHDVLKFANLDLAVSTKSLLVKANLNIYYQERVCLMGPNGSGKTTLIKEILKNNSNIYLAPSAKIAYISQELAFEDNERSVLEEARKHFIGPEEYLRSALFKFLFTGELVHKKIKFLSGGEKVRLKLFCLMQENYNFLILDEPTNHIDIDTREILENALLKFPGTILFVSHDRYFINKIATHVVYFNNKKLEKHLGNYSDFLKICQKISTKN